MYMGSPTFDNGTDNLTNMGPIVIALNGLKCFRICALNTYFNLHTPFGGSDE